MRKNKLRITFVATALASLTLTGCSCSKTVGKGEFTYRSYTTALASNWNPHSWETSADSAVLDYLTEGFVNLAPKNTQAGEYQWVFDMAESITDVTKDSAATLATYLSDRFPTEEEAQDWIDGLPEDNPGQIVYQIKLREGLKWEDGTAINAESFVRSADLLLDPNMKNYRANLYIAGESAIAGALGRFYSDSLVYVDNLTHGDFAVASMDDLELVGGKYVQKDSHYGVFLGMNHSVIALGGETLKSYVDKYPDYFPMTVWEQMLDHVSTEQTDSHAYELELNETTMPLIEQFFAEQEAFNFGGLEGWQYFLFVEELFPEKDFESVGLYKEESDEAGLTFNYVMATPLDESQAFVSFTSTWLVHEATYNDNKDTSGDLVTSRYGTSVASTKSYGPYRLETLEAAKQMVLVRNENWHGWTKDEEGKLSSTTLFEVDGSVQPQYQATKVVIDVLDDAAAKQKFLAGELSSYAPTASELSEYTLSDSLYQVDETYQMSFFMNTNPTDLKNMDINEGNTNSIVLSNENFRKAMSLAIDRAEFVTKTAGYKPAFSLLNNLYYYDVWNDPSSRYRNSEPAMQALVNLYEIEYGEGKTYATLEEAHASITGHNLTQAKELMALAHEELVEAGDISAGANIKIKIAYAKGAIQSDELAQVAIIQKHLNAALEDSGFGTIELEAIGNLENRYAAVPEGKFAIGYGAWGGAAFYPFRNMQVYCDTDQYDVNERANWNPATETLTIQFEYEENGDTVTFEDTMTWKAWSNSMVGAGPYANASNAVKLRILAFMEEHYLKKYYRIPLASSTAAFLLSMQIEYFTEEYNIMYGFGGFRLLKFKMDDFQWREFVRKSGGTLDYK
jgi:oligopeptide transport system substrate-binding protein